jgi:glycosyltransferase involved in cell wall biosynthesis
MTVVAFDIRANHATGVARYGESVLAAAAPIAAENSIRLLIITRPGQEAATRSALAYDHQAITIPGDDGFVRRSAKLRGLLARGDVDFFHTSHYTVDHSCPVPFSFTIHDLTRWRFPELSYSDESFIERFGASELLLLEQEIRQMSAFDSGGDSVFTRYFKAVNRHMASQARRIVTVSASSAQDIARLLGLPDSAIDLVPCGVDTEVFRPRSSAEVDAVRTRFKLGDGPYLMFVGLAHKHKRFEWLADHLAHAHARLPHGSRVAVVGGHAEQSSEGGPALVTTDAGNLFAFLGRVSDEELAALYTGASAWVTASVNEGNNLPPLEALACGTEVIATDIPPLRETIGACGHFYPPDDPHAMVALAEAALGARLPHRAPKFRAPTWDDAGRLLVDSWQRSLGDTS